MAVQFQIGARGVAGIGGGVPASTNLSSLSAGTPAFWTLVLFAALVTIIIVVASSLR